MNKMSLWEAAKNGDLVAVKDTVGELSNIDKHDDYGYSALHYACEQGHYLIAEYLLHQQADVNDLTEGKEKVHIFGEDDPKYPLHLAAVMGHLDIVELLLKNDIDVNCGTEKKEETPLHLSSLHGHLAVAKYLIMHGGDVKRVNCLGYTALHYCSGYGHLSLVKYLVSAGTNINHLSEFGGTALHIALKTSSSSLNIVKFLIEKGSNLQSTDEDGKTPLTLAREYILRVHSHLRPRPKFEIIWVCESPAIILYSAVLIT